LILSNKHRGNIRSPILSRYHSHSFNVKRSCRYKNGFENETDLLTFPRDKLVSVNVDTSTDKNNPD